MTETEERTVWEIKFVDGREPVMVNADGWHIEAHQSPIPMATFSDIDDVPIYSVRLAAVFSIRMAEALDYAPGDADA